MKLKTRASARERNRTPGDRPRAVAHVYETLVAKLNAARVRRETLNGREYVVVPTAIMQPDSVMHGSKGPLFYPRAEVAKNVGAWNGVPLLHNHPSEGQSGRTPRTMAAQGLGYCYNDRVTKNGVRVVDAWFDVELVKRHDRDLPADKRILPRVEGGVPVDVSTGLFTDERRVTNRRDARKPAKTADVETYNYRPDHLAVLPTTRGACSVEDRCGAGVENVDHYSRDSKGRFAASAGARLASKKSMTSVAMSFAADAVKAAKEGDSAKAARMHDQAAAEHERSAKRRKDEGNTTSARDDKIAARKHREAAKAHRGTTNSDQNTNGGDDMKLNRKKAVAFLTTNCDCWKDKAAALNKLDDDALRGVLQQGRDLLANREAVAATRELLGIEDDEAVVFNAEYVKSPDMKKKMKAACADEEEPVVKKNAKGKAAEDDEDPADLDERVQAAVAEAVESHPTVKNAARVMARERGKLVARLTAVANAKGTPAAKKSMLLNKLKLKGDDALGVEELEELLVLSGGAVTNESDDDRRADNADDDHAFRNRPLRADRHEQDDDSFEFLLPDYRGAGGGATVDNADDEGEPQEFDNGDWNPAVDWAGAVTNRVKALANGKPAK